MSEHALQHIHPWRHRRDARGQSLVEFALLLPLLILLLLGAIDFGRVFFGWVDLQNAARIGANYAATHPDAWALGNTTQQAEYSDLVSSSGARNCTITVNPPTFPDGTRTLGDRARVSLSCSFTLVTPFLGPLVGQPVVTSATSTFPIRQGCANCGSSGSAPAPPPPPNCRSIPNLVGMSVAGARSAWVASGFTGSFTPDTGDDSRTVASRSINQNGEVGCDGTTNAFFSSSVTVTFAPVIEPGPTDTCRTVPNMLGMTVASARTAWQSAGFDPVNFTPASGSDAQIVNGQTFTPGAVAGECMEPDLLVTVTFGPPPPPPPPPPCRVPSFVNTLRANAQATWAGAGFTTTVRYQPPANNWTLIQSQDLVGGSWAGCASVITVSKNG